MNSRRLMVLLVALCGWLGLSTAAAHQITFSQVDIHLRKSTTSVEIQLPILALLHEQPSPLPAGTTEKALRAIPLSSGVQASLTKLLNARLRLAAGATAVPLKVNSVQAVGDNVKLTATAPALTGTLNVQANLFPEDSLHKIFVSVYREDTLAGQYALDRQNAGLSLAAPERPLGEIILTFIREGIHHIFIGPDHILFVLALILLGGRMWSQLKIITAFTVAHSITLALATLNIVELPSRLVESVIALSIVVVGLHDLTQLRRGTQHQQRDPRVIFAFVFGLIHGFGFASVLRELELPQSALAWSLAAFNVGVEIGQVTIVLLATPLLYVLRRYAPPRLAQGVLSAAASGVVLMGGFWLWQRLS